MKTGDLISALAADIRPAGVPLSRKFVLIVLAGAALAMAGFWAELGLRPDIGEAMATWRFNAKIAIVVLTMLLAVAECIRLCRPTAKASLLPVLAGIGLLGAAVLVELASVPSANWGARLIGSNAAICLTAIPLLSVAPFAALFLAMRSGAPAAPVATGAMAGFASATIAASLYALHCTDDSPLFVMTWYSAAILPVTAIGALLGRKFLRW